MVRLCGRWSWLHVPAEFVNGMGGDCVCWECVNGVGCMCLVNFEAACDVIRLSLMRLCSSLRLLATRHSNTFVGRKVGTRREITLRGAELGIPSQGGRVKSRDSGQGSPLARCWPPLARCSASGAKA